MALAPYVSPGDQLTASRWNTLIAEANARLKEAWNNQAACLCLQGGTDTLTDASEGGFRRKFYFGSALTTTETPATIAEAYCKRQYTRAASGLPVYERQYFRLYDHSTFTDILTQLALVTPPEGDPRPAKSLTYNIMRTTPISDLTTYLDAGWPVWAPSSHLVVEEDMLEYSLECHLITNEGNPYNVTVDRSGTSQIMPATHVDLWSPVEVIFLDGVGASFTWPDNYNRYCFIRFNNLQTVSVEVTVYAGTSPLVFSIPANSSRCVRRTGSGGSLGWLYCYEYLFTMLPGDPWFMGDSWITDGEFYNLDRSNVTDPSWMLGIGLSKLCDQVATKDPNMAAWTEPHSQAVDFSYAKDLGAEYGVDTFAAIADGTLLGDLLFHKGKLLVVNPALSGGEYGGERWLLDYNGLAGLSTLLEDTGITVTEAAGEITLSSSTELDIVSISSNLVYLLTKGYAGYTIKSGTDLVIPQFYAAAPIHDISAVVTEGSRSWIDVDTSEVQTVTWDNNTWEANPISDTAADYKHALTATWAEYKIWLGSLAGDRTPTVTMKMTPFGPIIRGSQYVDLGYPLVAGAGFGSPPEGADKFSAWDLALESVDDAWRITRTRDMPFFQLVANAFGSPVWTQDPHFAIFGWRYMQAFPKDKRAWLNRRYGNPDPATMPHFDGNSGFWASPTPLEMRPSVKDWWEMTPQVYWSNKKLTLSKLDGGTTYSAALLGPFVRATSFMPLLDAWLQQADFKELHLAAGGDDRTDLYTNERADILGSAHLARTTSRGEISALPMQAEQFNALASTVNSRVAVGQGKFISLAQSDLTFDTQGFVGFGIGTRKWRPAEQYAGWDTRATNPHDFFEALLGADKIYTSADFPSDWATLLAANAPWTGTGGPDPVEDLIVACSDPLFGLAWSEALDDATYYEWVKISEVKAAYEDLGIPFVMEETVVPAKLTIADATVTAQSPDPKAYYNSGWTYTRTAAFVNDSTDFVTAPEDYWVGDSNAVGSCGGNIIRSDISQVDYCYWSGDGGGFKRLNFGAAIGTAMVPSGSLNWSPTQGIIANKAYVVRRYGGKALDAVVFPRSYPDPDRNTGLGIPSTGLADGGSYIPHTSIDLETDLEANPPEVTQNLGDETILTTSLENGELILFVKGRTLTP